MKGPEIAVMVFLQRFEIRHMWCEIHPVWTKSETYNTGTKKQVNPRIWRVQLLVVFNQMNNFSSRKVSSVHETRMSIIVLLPQCGQFLAFFKITESQNDRVASWQGQIFQIGKILQLQTCCHSSSTPMKSERS